VIRRLIVLSAVLAAPLAAQAPAPVAPAAPATPAAADTSLKVAFGGFIDGYYAYDFGRPRTIDRALSTTAARANEFNVNLAFVDATLTAPRLRGRVALQFGTSVQANYAAEPRVGSYSGADVSRFIQEAYAGYKLSENLWVDAGVFLAPFGAESWISRDNVTYTRSLIADNSPYYESGAKLSWQATPTFALQAHVINGWQNVSETNSDKAFAVRADWTANSALTLTYDAFFGNEQPDSMPSRLRQFHEGIAKWTVNDRLTLTGSFDYGQEARTGNGSATWTGYAVLARLKQSDRVAFGARVEGYDDPDRVIVSVPGAKGLQAMGWSVNLDVTPQSRVLWRTELRQLTAKDRVFPDQNAGSGLAKGNTLLVTSLALTF
jgi:hypothetical protein